MAVPVTDQDSAQRLCTQLGFTTVLDAELRPGFRWIDLAAPDGGAQTVRRGSEPGGLRGEPPLTDGGPRSAAAGRAPRSR